MYIFLPLFIVLKLSDSMIRKAFSFILTLLLVTNLYGQWSPSSDSIKKHIYYLASSDLKGRMAGTEGDSLAAVYIRDHFQSFGSVLLCSNGFQYFTLVTDVKAGKGNRLNVHSKDFSPEVDFQPFSFSSSCSVEALVAFSGFGISGQSDSLTWDDYNSIDVKGKWALILRGDPEPDNPSSEFIPMASDRSKTLLARDKGAIGVLLVSPYSMEKSDRLIDITFDKSVSDAGIPVISITRKLAAFILNLPVSSIDSIEKRMLSQKSSITFLTESVLKATTSIERTKATTRNVIAMIEGADSLLKDEYIVVGAHYDHLGTGGNGSGSRVPDEIAVHGGADDNASGVASLIELARYFSVEKNRPARSMLFVAFGAEEMGILGSRYFVDNAPVPVKSIKAMINIDMVGRLAEDDPKVTISGTGTFNVADSILDQLAKDRSFSIRKTMDGYGPSDHASFYTAGIPVLFITTGAHGDYHTPLDTPEKINYNGQVQLTSFIAELASVIGNLSVAPIYAESGSKKESGQTGRNLKVTFGIMPDISGAETSGGMKVEGARKDAPAGRAGMMKGDIITAINGLPVSNVYDYMNRLSKLKQGETVNVEILRNNIKMVLIIQL